ncbi:MAG: NADH:ubiquinone reductase (Na(+)-transporting) subunit B [Bacteroidetes bacterium GWE2_29_8]|nr:MAG: NADH:ubiquinone reductase (Na(+)-transporting) subunit B [Bacteroidetes bacterium GWE2_29_8]OFY17429.1 MAG: NADH:ubiquinone reductase (Na(+)-transporting) subunit B [Bacteroidetes bacterium GWF2_29_10]
MKQLRKIIDNIKPNFQEGGKFEKLRSTFDAFETFLYVSNKVTNKGSHIRDSIDLKRTMSIVIMSLIPALLFGIWNVGYFHFLSLGEDNVSFFEVFFNGFIKVFPIIVVSYVSGLAVEFVAAQIRGHEVNEGFLVSGMLIPLVMPVDVPLWMVSIATIFAVIIGKEVFGGTGMNIFNPALLSRAFIFFAYPSKITGDLIWVSELSKNKLAVVDGFSGATPLGNAAHGAFDKIPDLWTLFWGFVPGSIGETSKFAILIGAFILIITRIGSFKIMLSFVLGGVVMSSIFNIFAVNEFMQLSPLYHILLGSFLFGAVFMATDPVTAAQTSIGKYIYGFLGGFFAIMIRVFNPAYPEGTMLSILLMNTFAPLIDYYVIQSNINRRLNRVKNIN